jgi:hypothetical protein
VDATTEGGAEHLNKLSQRYLGTDYPAFGGGGQTRVILTIEADSVHQSGNR